jgi:phage host-nuclease inhibitor protein Gam
MTTKTRETKKINTDHISKDQADKIFKDWAQADAKIRKINADMDQKMNEIRSANQKELTKLSELKDEKFEQLQHFALSNADDFEEKKSMEFPYGRLGFRTGTPKLKLLSKFTWDRVVDKLESSPLSEFVRIKKEADKESLLSNRDNADVNKHFSAVGISVVQDETFFVEAKKEEAV